MLMRQWSRVGFKSVLIILTLLGVIVWAVFRYIPSNKAARDVNHKDAFPIAVEAIEVMSSVFYESAQALGTVQAIDSVVLSSEQTGKVEKIHFKDGQEVKRGAVLIQLSSGVEKAQLLAALADYQLTNRNYQRAKELFVKQFISQGGLDEARAKLDNAQAGYYLAKAQYDKTLVRAPFAGHVGIRQVREGEYVREGTPLIGMERTDGYWVDFHLPEHLATQVHKGQVLELGMNGLGEGKKLLADIVALDAQYQSQGRSLWVRAKIKTIEPIEREKLRSGMFAQVSLRLHEKPNALLVPEQALLIHEQKPHVFVVRGDTHKTVELRPVKVGKRMKKSAQVWVDIESGLSKTDWVVTAGHQKLRPGASINIVGAEHSS
jgi:membrane fusion protein (multidrug efflux system)